MKILDTTIRDGSYAVDFKFSCKDVQDLVLKSSKIGIEYIEIGHGMGLNASSLEHGFSLQTDMEYMKAAKQVSGNSKLGFFCIPNIARIKDIDIANENGIAFIRIGVNVGQYKEAIPYIERAKKYGMEVFVNFMKTYAYLPEQIAEVSKYMAEQGVKGVYIVDSAGSMEKNDIGRYIDAIRKKTDIPMGFHGHNNLGLAVENTIYCVEQGIEYIDCTYQGLGRSLGNASLEQVVMVLEKRGYKTGYDVPRVLEYGYAALKNIVRDKLTNPLDYVCGYTGFHSSFLKEIYRCSSENQVDPLRLIIAFSKENVVTMDYGRLCEIANTMPKDQEDNPYSFAEYFTEKYRE